MYKIKVYNVSKVFRHSTRGTIRCSTYFPFIGVWKSIGSLLVSALKLAKTSPRFAIFPRSFVEPSLLSLGFGEKGHVALSNFICSGNLYNLIGHKRPGKNW